MGFLLYTAYYVILEPFAGLSWGVILGIPVVGSCTYFQQHVPHAWAWALGAHLLAWFMQASMPPSSLMLRSMSGGCGPDALE